MGSFRKTPGIDDILYQCPFCGGRAHVVYKDIHDRDCALTMRVSVRCEKCAAETGGFYSASVSNVPGISDDPESDAVDSWNRRAGVCAGHSKRKNDYLLSVALSSLRMLCDDGKDTFYVRETLECMFREFSPSAEELELLEAYGFNYDELGRI